MDDKTFEKHLGHWFSGSGDRLPGGRKGPPAPIQGQRHEEQHPGHEEDESDENLPASQVQILPI